MFYFISIYLWQDRPILDIGAWVHFFGSTFFEKRAFYLLPSPKQMSFLTIFNGTIFLKIQGTRLGVIVKHNKGLE